MNYHHVLINRLYSSLKLLLQRPDYWLWAYKSSNSNCVNIRDKSLQSKLIKELVKNILKLTKE